MTAKKIFLAGSVPSPQSRSFMCSYLSLMRCQANKSRVGWQVWFKSIDKKFTSCCYGWHGIGFLAYFFSAECHLSWTEDQWCEHKNTYFFSYSPSAWLHVLPWRCQWQRPRLLNRLLKRVTSSQDWFFRLRLVRLIGITLELVRKNLFDCGCGRRFIACGGHEY